MGVQLNSPPPKKQNDIQTMRGSTLGQMHYGQVQGDIPHPFQKFLLKTTFTLNIFSFLILWSVFAMKSIFPPHDAAFRWAIGAYFIFGCVYGVFSFFFFKFAKFIEHQMVTKALTQNRSYEWHSQYQTDGITDADLKKKAAEKSRAATVSVATNAGANYFRIAGFLALAGIFTCFLGWWSFFGDVL